jgi:hypothetical protein
MLASAANGALPRVCQCIRTRRCARLANDGITVDPLRVLGDLSARAGHSGDGSRGVSHAPAAAVPPWRSLGKAADRPDRPRGSALDLDRPTRGPWSSQPGCAALHGGGPLLPASPARRTLAFLLCTSLWMTCAKRPSACVHTRNAGDCDGAQCPPHGCYLGECHSCPVHKWNAQVVHTPRRNSS